MKPDHGVGIASDRLDWNHSEASRWVVPKCTYGDPRVPPSGSQVTRGPGTAARNPGSLRTRPRALYVANAVDCPTNGPPLFMAPRAPFRFSRYLLGSPRLVGCVPLGLGQPARANCQKESTGPPVRLSNCCASAPRDRDNYRNTEVRRGQPAREHALPRKDGCPLQSRLDRPVGIPDMSSPTGLREGVHDHSEASSLNWGLGC